MRHIITIFVILCVLALAAQEDQNSIRIPDNSDWWSAMRDSDNHWSRITPQQIRTPNSSLQILGISLRENNDPTKHIIQSFGPTTEITRGDASTGRAQYCYSSIDRKIHLIFEFGEVESAFYLFETGKGWNGERYCKISSRVRSSASTPSGLRLGMSRGELEKILGKPSVSTPERIRYFRSLSVKSSSEELKRARSYAPDMPESEFEENYAYYDFNTYIEARFRNSRLIFLAISQSETL